MRLECYKLDYGNYKFTVELDTGAETGAQQLTLWFREKGAADAAWQSLRDFYFEEADERNIRTFCQRFAVDEVSREEVLTGKTRWSRRNALFVRNLLSVVGENALLSNDGSYDHLARDFFHWLDTHLEAILALPEYQRLQELDGAFQPGASIDPDIRSAVEIFKQIPGVTTRFSCQGVSGKVQFQEHDLLVVSPHEEYAYVSFATLGVAAHDALVALLPAYPHITTARIPCNFALGSVLRSTGDNLLFREELLVLATRLLEQVDASWHTQSAKEMNLSGQDVIYPLCCPPTSAPGGLLPSRLAWLCQPAHIEHTLLLVYYLNHWAKARELLLYADRQGLYQVKAVILQQAHAVGVIQSVIYIDGSQAFACDYDITMAAIIAAEVFCERLADVLARKQSTVDVDDALDQSARQLFLRITGREALVPSDVAELDEKHVSLCISEYLLELVERARSTRQPIEPAEIAALFIEPADLLDIPGRRNGMWVNWEDLDEGDLRKLDPEGLSLVAFLYHSPTAHYVFHLPLRVAETFLPTELVQELKKHPGHSREYGLYYGRPITEMESQQYAIKDILDELLVDISTICPHGLINKEQHVRSLPANNYSDDGDDDDEDDDFVMDEPYRPKKSKRKHRATTRVRTKCPLCKYAVEAVGTLRLEHWRQLHKEQDLTIGQVAWVLGKSKATLKSFTVPPAYRVPSIGTGDQKTRYWKLETLEDFILESHEEPQKLVE